EDLLRQVIRTLVMYERRVTDNAGRHYSLRVRPYRTADNKIDGAVITLLDIDEKEESDGSKAANAEKQFSPRK
ncbi:MAG: PAS domain-containing protein, partial [Chthoniobacterales bacterium]